MITYDCLDIKQIDIIKPLWAKLSIYHKEVSVFFLRSLIMTNFYEKRSDSTEGKRLDIHGLLSQEACRLLDNFCS